MSSRPARTGKKDEDMGSVELLGELNRLHRQSAREREEMTARIEELRIRLERQTKAEEAIKKSERDFRAIVTKNADAIVVLDGDGRVRYVNPAAETLFCMAATEMVGKLFGFPIVPDEPVDMYVLREFKTFLAVEMRLVEATWDDKPS